MKESVSAALEVIDIEVNAILSLRNSIDDTFDVCCQHILFCKGRVIVLGMGKSGHIGAKIAATLASTGTPAFYVHPAEACHGDLGMITESDLILAISNSGNTQEIIELLPMIKRLKIPLIAITGNPQSILAKESLVFINTAVTKEACPLNLAPTSSTTVALVVGDALAVALLKARQFNKHDFARMHPGGALGRRLTLTVEDIGHKNEELPLVKPNASIAEVLIEITKKKLGVACIVNEHKQLKGIFTDGDVRRALNKGFNIYETAISEVMTTDSITINQHMLAADALKIMNYFTITALVLTDNDQSVVGVVSIHDILRAGFIIDKNNELSDNIESLITSSIRVEQSLA